MAVQRVQNKALCVLVEGTQSAVDTEIQYREKHREKMTFYMTTWPTIR